jgi:predicted DNA-binding transcriptional regulator YafY
MPKIKNAHLRYRIIDKALKNPKHLYPTLDDLRRLCAEAVEGVADESFISVSTIEKDLNAMRNNLDAPVKYSRQHNGYCYSDPNFSLEGVPLTPEEIESLSAAVGLLAHFKNVPVFRQFGSAIDKLTTKLFMEGHAQKQISEFIQFEHAPSQSGSEHLSLFADAIYRRLSVTFHHKKFSDNESTHRKIDPYLLKEYRNRWYVIGFSHTDNAMRTFGLERIQNIEITDIEFTRDPHFNPDMYFKYSIGITTGEGRPEKILFHASATLTRYLETQPIHESQTIVASGKEGSTLQLFVCITPELLIILRGYGKSLKVQEPASLVKLMKEEAAEMNKFYSK